MCIKK
jgi:hypothetical protein